MTRLRKIALGGAAAALIMTGAASQSFAEEPGTFTNHLAGGSVGAPLGAAPPPGLYAVNETLWGVVGNAAITRGNAGIPGPIQPSVNAVLDAVILVYSTGINIFGGSWLISIAQAWYNVDVFFPAGTLGAPANVALVYNQDIANTAWNPVTLSWNLGQGWFFSAGMNIIGPDGSHFVGTSVPDYWTFEPTAAISFINAQWVATVNMFYDINTASAGHCCALGTAAGGPPGQGFKSGDLFWLDASIAAKIGKWQIGPAFSMGIQTTNDSPGTGLTCATPVATQSGSICGRYQNIAAGGVISYDFGPVDVRVWALDSFKCQDVGGCGGWSVFSTIAFRLWGPEAPAAKPLVSKN
jgi:hypothetical protein